MDIVSEMQAWGAAIAAARLDGFEVHEGDNDCFVLWLGNATRAVAYGPDVLQRAIDAAFELLAVEEARAAR